MPLVERKKQLWRLVDPACGAIQSCEHVEADGREFLAAVDGMGLEGMVSKRAGSAYRTGRADGWL